MTRREFLKKLAASPLILLGLLLFPTIVWNYLNDSNYITVELDKVRRTYPSLIANDLVGVQPMTGPVGEVFKLKISYEPYQLELFPKPSCWG